MYLYLTEEDARKVKSLELLPWESEDESKSIISQALMADILQLALSEKNFTHPPPAKILECCNFNLQMYISQAMRLLTLDQNLAHIHAKISPKMNEELFWKHYFTRIYYLRCKSGILDSQDDAIVQTVSSFAEEDVLFKSDHTVEVNAKPSLAETVNTSPTKPRTTSPTSGLGGGGGGGKKSAAWENSSSEDVSGSEMSTSSYEVVTASGKGSSGSGSVGIHDDEKVKANDEEALFEAQVCGVCVCVCVSVCHCRGMYVGSVDLYDIHLPLFAAPSRTRRVHSF
jgi:hypothetical protein